MKTIDISTPGHPAKFTKVDDDIFREIAHLNWYYCLTGSQGSETVVRAQYRKKKRHTVLLSRYIMQPQQGQVVDHINHDRLDNRRCNLRLCEQSQNMCNQKRPSTNTSGYKGVSRKGKKWHAQIGVDYKTVHLGNFFTKSDAAKAYDKAARKYHGEYANLNCS